MERASFDDFASVMKEKNGERVSLEEELMRNRSIIR
jgi:hypothetical protein